MEEEEEKEEEEEDVKITSCSSKKQLPLTMITIKNNLKLV